MRWWPWGCSTGTARAATPTRPKAIATSFAVSPPILAGCATSRQASLRELGPALPRLDNRRVERARHQGLFGVLCRREDAADFSRRHVGEQPDCGAFTRGAISMVALSNLHRHRDGTGLRAGRDCARSPAF